MTKFISVVALLGMLGLVACGGGSSKVPPPTVTPSPVAVSLTPSTATVVPLGKQQFIASVTMSDGSTNNNAAFTATGNGTVDSVGVFTAAASNGPATITANAGSLFTDATVAVVAPTSPGPSYVQAAACGGSDLPPSCLLTTTAGNALVYVVYPQPPLPIILTDNVNDDFVPNTATRQFGAAFAIVGGSTSVTAPAGYRVFLFEYSGATSVGSFANATDGLGGNGQTTPYGFTVVTNADNSTMVAFVLVESNQTFNAGASSTSRFQLEDSAPLAVLLEDQPAPIAADYTMSFVPANPAAYESQNTALVTLVLQ